jgi:hypothetical protein
MEWHFIQWGSTVSHVRFEVKHELTSFELNIDNYLKNTSGIFIDGAKWFMCL